MVRYQKGASRVAFVPPERTLAKTARARAHPNRHATFLAPSLCLAAPFFRIGLLWEKDHRRACQQEKKRKTSTSFWGTARNKTVIRIRDPAECNGQMDLAAGCSCWALKKSGHSKKKKPKGHPKNGPQPRATPIFFRCAQKCRWQTCLMLLHVFAISFGRPRTVSKTSKATKEKH